MRKLLYLIIYLSFLLPSCDVHEFPEEVLLTKEYFTISFDFDTDMQEQDYFYDSQWHCTNAGAAIRTKNLLDDLKAYLDDPGNY